MITIASVLRSGGDYAPRHVEALRRMCERHAPAHRFVCLTDTPEALDCDTLALAHDWPGWWAKVELFRLPGPVLYFDLDTIIVRDIAPLLELADGEDFVVCRDFYRGVRRPLSIQSSMMYWSGDLSRLYAQFVTEPRFYMGGDQEWLEQHFDGEPTFWQDIAPGAIGSFKASPRSEAERVIIFHGRPRPWEQSEVSYAAA